MPRPLLHAFFDPTTSTVTHVVADPATGRAAVIDPVLDYDPRSGRTSTRSANLVVDHLHRHGLTLDWLLETHAHADHLSAAPYLQRQLGGRIGIGEHIREVQQVFRRVFNDASMPVDGRPFDRLFADGERFLIGTLPVRVMHTPGHTAACVSYVVGGDDDADIFIGDTLFMPDYGSARCDFPGGDAAALHASVRRLLALPPLTRLHLCHDYAPVAADGSTRAPAWVSTVAAQRAHNVHLHDGVSEAEFVAMRTARDRTLGMPQLLLPSIQVNVRAGHLPEPEGNGTRYLKIPLDASDRAGDSGLSLHTLRATLQRSLRAYFRGPAAPARDDIVAAGVLAILLVPQSLAYALLAGLPAHVGLYASLLPVVAYALLGSSPLLGIGPVALLALMISQALAQARLVAPGVAPEAAALVLAFEVGAMLALAAALRLDALASLLSTPVLRGFEAGAAVSIAASQLPVLLGAAAGGPTVPEVISSWWRSATPWTPAAAAFGLGALLLLWASRSRVRRALGGWLGAPGALMAERLVPLLLLLLAMGLAWWWQAPRHGVALVGPLPTLGLALSLPPLDAGLWSALLPSALPIALVGYVSSFAVAESLALRRGQRVEPRRELAGLAGANLVASFSGGMPVAASLSRSVVNHEAGVRTRAGGVWVALLMALAIALLAVPLAWLPKSVLAATILVAVLGVLDFGSFREARRFAREEWVQMCVVAALAACVGVGSAIAAGVAISVALLLKRSAQPHVAVIGRVPGTEHFRNVERYEVERVPGLLQLRIDESLVFTNARELFEIVTRALGSSPPDAPEALPIRRVVLLMSPVNHVDFSGLEALKALHEALAAREVRLDLSEVKGPVLDALHAAQWERWFRGRVYLSHHQAVSEAPAERV